MRKGLLTPGLKFAFDVLPGGQWEGRLRARLVYILASSGVLEAG